MHITGIALLNVLVATGFSLGACDSLDNLTNMLDTKKKLAGDRKPVFPEGVPGVSMGVPPEMMKGYQQGQPAQQGQPPAQARASGQQAADQKAAAKPEAKQPDETPKPKKVVGRPPRPKPAPTATA